jgi:hypothetical protein
MHVVFNKYFQNWFIILYIKSGKIEKNFIIFRSKGRKREFMKFLLKYIYILCSVRWQPSDEMPHRKTCEE